MWQLAVRDNWELVFSERHFVTYKDGTLPTNDNYKYIPISPLYTTVKSHALLIGVQSNSALSHWFLGARASQYLYVSPSTSENLINGVGTPEIKRLKLNQLTFVEFPNYNILPYLLQLEIPYWLEDIYVEVWEHKGQFINEELEELRNIKMQLNRLEEKMNQFLNK